MAPLRIEILLDDARPGFERLRYFADPCAVVEARQQHQVAGALDALERQRGAGKYVAGYFSYELGYVLEPKLTPLLPARRAVPLLWFAVFDSYKELCGGDVRQWLNGRVRGRAYGGLLTHEWRLEEYAKRFSIVHELIESGDIYQTNLSFRSRFAGLGDPMALYLSLREKSGAAHCAYIDDGERHILSLSPELFFSISATGEIVARPMKGTAPRGTGCAQDAAMKAHLATSKKDRAENLMIVDLLRNDLGRVAQLGSVNVSELFKVETYPTLHTMVSTVRAQICPGTSVGSVARALFPCGSITGAPKIRAMEVIHELEASPRGVYCGAIGTFAPDGSADFNVAIRTLTLTDQRGELGIGGAIVHDSNVSSEYNECLLKARYYEVDQKPLMLIETLRYSPELGFVRFGLHMARMRKSAGAFGFEFDPAAAIYALETAVAASSEDLRVRLVLNEYGVFECVAAPFPFGAAASWTYTISPYRTQSGDIFLQHKTTWREAYEAAMTESENADEVLFTNDRGALTEGSRTNIFVRKHGRLLTPPLPEGVLDGCLRRELIDDGKCEEAKLYPVDLETAELVFLGNSLRGLIPAVPA